MEIQNQETIAQEQEQRWILLTPQLPDSGCVSQPDFTDCQWTLLRLYFLPEVVSLTFALSLTWLDHPYMFCLFSPSWNLLQVSVISCLFFPQMTSAKDRVYVHHI